MKNKTGHKNTKKIWTVAFRDIWAIIEIAAFIVLLAILVKVLHEGVGSSRNSSYMMILITSCTCLTICIVLHILRLNSYRKSFMTIKFNLENTLSILSCFVKQSLRLCSESRSLVSEMYPDSKDFAENGEMDNMEKLIETIEKVRENSEKWQSLIIHSEYKKNIQKNEMDFLSAKAEKELEDTSMLLESIFHKLAEERKEARTAAARILFECTHVLPVIEKLTNSTEHYEKETVSAILGTFEEIWDKGKKLVDESGDIITSFSHGSISNEQSLSYIADKNEMITEKISGFLDIVGKLEKTVNHFLESSIKGLEGIHDTAGVIEDMSERIRIISINVRIEAARISGRQSGFNVLGQEITDFAEQTSRFAHSTHEQIEHTFRIIRPIREELIGDLAQVRKDMQEIGNAIAPYRTIISNTLGTLDRVIQNLGLISTSITDKMKQTIGNMQFHDIISQEVSHIIYMMNMLDKNCKNHTEKTGLEEALDEPDKQKIKTAILSTLKSCITTANEHKILEASREEMAIPKEEEDVYDLSNSRNLDEKTILF